MEKKTIRLIKWVLLIFSLIAFLVFSIVFYSSLIISRTQNQAQNETNPSDTCLYHIIITGTYENQAFLSDLYKGAASVADSYKALVDLHVPDSQADTTSIQKLFDYCSFMNADGIIAYIDSPDENPLLLKRTDNFSIPLITTGQFSPNLQQVSFIGINNWELGKKIADEIHSLLAQGGYVYIINSSLTTNYSNLISSIQSALQENQSIQTRVIENLPEDMEIYGNNNIFICLTEEETIRMAQELSEKFLPYNYKLLGFGGNEVCQLYLQKGFIAELFSLDPETIGRSAMKELFEYRSNGYANSYITADVTISRTE